MSTFVKSAIIACLSTVALVASAQEASVLSGWTIGATTLSQHDAHNDRLNNLNPGFYAVSPEGYAFGLYKNSFRRPSVWAGRVFSVSVVDLTVGVIGGYRRRLSIHEEKCSVKGYEGVWCDRWDTGVKGYLSPLVAPSIALPPTEHGFRFRMTFIPGFGSADTRANVVNFSVEHVWK